jgi:hypothetical protein
MPFGTKEFTMPTALPSPEVATLIENVSRRRSMAGGLRTIMEREREFPNRMAAQLTGIALDPASRAYVDQQLDLLWQSLGLPVRRLYNEVIIGSGFHAATYAATRAPLLPKPLVLERSVRAGGVFAIPGPVFYLNSRNRRGGIGLSGDTGTNPNYLPGAPIQTASLSTGDYQTNADMAFVIRLALAQYADVRINSQVAEVAADFDGTYTLYLSNGSTVRASRIIDARGLGDPRDLDKANGRNVLTFPQFLQRMASKWPLRGIRRAAVIGAGDAARVSIEALLGIGPQPNMAAAELDEVGRIDAYGDLPDTMAAWCASERGRYNKIGRALRPDRFGVQRLNVYSNTRPEPVKLPDAALVNGRAYDLIVLATGNSETTIGGLPEQFDMESYRVAGIPVARRGFDSRRNIYRVGPHAGLSFTTQEVQDGVADIPNNAVSMFRLASKTATLAANVVGIR